MLNDLLKDEHVASDDGMPIPEFPAGPKPKPVQPLLKRWHTVEVVAAEGTELGLVEDNDGGVVTIIVRRDQEPWPHGMEPKAGGVNKILPGHRVYCVVSDDRGYGLSAWQAFAGYCRSCALSGESDPMDFECFINHSIKSTLVDLKKAI